jgi:hypothetical protein
MSEAELHVLRARLRGGIRNYAQRAALRLPLPMGLAYAEDDTVILDPDAQIRASQWDAVHDFQTQRVGHGHGKVFSHQGAALSSSCAHRSAQRRGPLLTAAPQHNASSVLRNPRYAGAFCAWRARARRNSLTVRIIPRPFPRINGSFSSVALTLGISPGRSMKRICIRCSRIVPQTREDRRHGPAREGPALQKATGHLWAVWESDDAALLSAQARNTPVS